MGIHHSAPYHTSNTQPSPISPPEHNPRAKSSAIAAIAPRKISRPELIKAPGKSARGFSAAVGKEAAAPTARRIKTNARARERLKPREPRHNGTAREECDCDWVCGARGKNKRAARIPVFPGAPSHILGRLSAAAAAEFPAFRVWVDPGAREGGGSGAIALTRRSRIVTE